MLIPDETTPGKTSPGKARPVIRARLKRPEILLACGKCLRRHRDGKALRRALKEAARAGGRTRIVRAGCLGLCPGRGVAVASAATLARGEVVVLARPEDAEAALAALREGDGALSFARDRA
jgi:hypothetical protein